MKVIMMVELDAEELDDEKLVDMQQAVVKACKEWGHNANVEVISSSSTSSE